MITFPVPKINFLPLAGGTLTGRLILPSVDNAADPTLAFGDGFGIYRRDDNLRFATNGVARIQIDVNGSMRGLSGTGWLMTNTTATATIPTFQPSKGDTDTGIGHAGDDALSLIAGGVEGVRIAEVGGIAAVHLPELASAPTAIPNFGVFFTKNDNKAYFQDGDGDVHELSTSADHRASFGLHENSTPTVIGESGTPVGVRLMSSNKAVNFTFDAGSTGAIASFADGGGGQVVVGTVAHGLLDGEIISITGTTNYNGVFVVQNKADDTYEITVAFNGDDGAANWYQASSMTVGALGAGDYAITYAVNAESAAANKSFGWHMYINDAEDERSHSDRNFTGSAIEQNVAGTTMVTLAANDILWLAVTGLSDGTDIIHDDVSIVIHRVS